MSTNKRDVSQIVEDLIATALIFKSHPEDASLVHKMEALREERQNVELAEGMIKKIEILKAFSDSSPLTPGFLIKEVHSFGTIEFWLLERHQTNESIRATFRKKDDLILFYNLINS